MAEKLSVLIFIKKVDVRLFLNYFNIFKCWFFNLIEVFEISIVCKFLWDAKLFWNFFILSNVFWLFGGQLKTTQWYVILAAWLSVTIRKLNIYTSPKSTRQFKKKFMNHAFCLFLSQVRERNRANSSSPEFESILGANPKTASQLPSTKNFEGRFRCRNSSFNNNSCNSSSNNKLNKSKKKMKRIILGISLGLRWWAISGKTMVSVIWKNL